MSPHARTQEHLLGEHHGPRRGLTGPQSPNLGGGPASSAWYSCPRGRARPALALGTWEAAPFPGRPSRPGGCAPSSLRSWYWGTRVTVNCGDQVQHFKVLRTTSGKYSLWGEKSNSLIQLVGFHCTTSIAKKQHIFLQDEEPPIKPPQAYFTQALFNFSAQDPSQLSIRPGNTIEVLERPGPHWWRGRLAGHLGFFPRSYVHPVHL